MAYMPMREYYRRTNRAVDEKAFICPECGKEKSVQIETVGLGYPDVFEVCNCGWNELDEKKEAAASGY